MIEILDSPNHLVAFKLTGSMTAEDVETAYKATDTALKNSERVSFFIEVDDSMNLTFEGLIKDMVTGLKHIGELSSYYRAAIVTGKGWLASLARVEGLIFFTIDMRVFEPADRDKAFAWAAEAPVPVVEKDPPTAALHVLSTTADNVFAYEIDGRLREIDIKNVVQAINPYFEREGKINVLGRFTDLHGFDLMSVLDDDLIKVKYRALSKVDRYALVGAQPWMRNLLELIDPLFSAKIKVFGMDEEEAAWEWVGAKQNLLP